MDVCNEVAVSRIAEAMGVAARARMLFCLADGRAHTSTELAVVAEVTPSTASAHLGRLLSSGLVKVMKQGKHRYHQLANPHVADALEALSVAAGAKPAKFTPTAPARLLAARTCYDHIAGSLGVRLHDRLIAANWLTPAREGGYDVAAKAASQFARFAIDVEQARAKRRRFAYPCLDWSERRPHLGGALASALLHAALQRKWVIQDVDSRALEVTRLGRRQWKQFVGLDW